MSKPRMPQVLSDLYRDLRDRRLLPVVILLLVAVVAVPVVLSVSSGTPPPPASSAQVAEEVKAPEAQPAVLAVSRGLRDYRERLAELNRRNPFRQQFQGAGLSKTEVEGISSGAGDATISGGEASAGGDGGVASATITSGGTTDSGSSGSGSGGASKTESVTKLETYRVEVSYGRSGSEKKLKDLEPLDPLDPVAVFVGVSEDGKKALFFVSSEVRTASGGGVCVPLGATGCGLLVLKAGEVVRLEYTPDGNTYTLKLSEIERVLLE